jgi:N-acetylneuraminate synthase
MAAVPTSPPIAGLGTGRCFVIGEVALTHDGSLGLAHAFIDAIAAAGADAVKFQTHIAAAESTPAEPFRVPFSRQDASRYDYWKRMEFTEDQWRGLAAHALERGLVFLSSPFSLEAVDLLQRIGMPLWKIASGETSNALLLDRATRAQLLLGTAPIKAVSNEVDIMAKRKLLLSDSHQALRWGYLRRDLARKKR